MHSSDSADVEVIVSFSPPYFPLVLERNYAAILRLDKFSSTGSKRYLAILDSDTHQGRRLVLRVRPTTPRCLETVSNQVSVCESLSCCARNPFGGFHIEVAADKGGAGNKGLAGNNSHAGSPLDMRGSGQKIDDALVYAASAPNANCISAGPSLAVSTACTRSSLTPSLRQDG
jgi:hypothetical protein